MKECSASWFVLQTRLREQPPLSSSPDKLGLCELTFPLHNIWPSEKKAKLHRAESC